MPATAQPFRPHRRYQFPFLALLLALMHSVTGCATLPPPSATDKPTSRAIDNPQSTALGQRVAKVAPSPALTGLRIVSAGTDALATLTTLADQAERTLDLQYYLVHNEQSTRALLGHVRAAADRGVRVRLLVDDMHTAGNDDAFRRMTEHPRIEVRVYNPLPSGRFSTMTKVMSSLTDMDRINRRMHNKMFVADNAVAFTGGRNLGDAYFLQSDTANFVDLDLVVAGPAVQALSRSFDRYWNSALAYPIAAFAPAVPPPASAASKELDVTPPATSPADSSQPVNVVARQIATDGKFELQWAPTRLLDDKPSKIENPDSATPADTMFDDVATLLRSAQSEVVIISPYLVPGQRGMAIFRELRQRGVKVRILTSSLAATDAPVVHLGYERYRRPMLKAGIELYELRPVIGEAQTRFGTFGGSAARLHAKALEVDGQWLLIGSMNLDRRSMDLNTEIGLLARSPALAGDLRKLFDDVVRKSAYRVELSKDGDLRWITRAPDVPDQVADHEPESTWWRRLQLHLLAPFAPEEML
jgi:phosphatidylserine/phosphatidylglycerophosphate/cardiolipin synthase-like enzyme